MTAATRVALITGANKGIGLEIARQLGKLGVHVVVGARDPKKGEEAAAQLAREGLKATPVRLDVTVPDTITPALALIEKHLGRLDILVNNAGVFLDRGVKPGELSPAVLRETLETNVVGVLALTRAALPMLRKSDAPRVVNVSSQLGSLSGVSKSGGMAAAAYQTSKAALNMLTISLAHDLKGFKVNSCCPGWCKTDMGGQDATRTAAQGAQTPVWLATLPADGPTGGFFSDMKPMGW